MRALYAGGPCSCGEGRRVRYMIPRVPGVAEAVVSCRLDGETGQKSVREHPPLPGDVLMLRIPDLVNGYEADS